jgi:hypothetical protein
LETLLEAPCELPRGRAVRVLSDRPLMTIANFNHYAEFAETFVPQPSVHLQLNITSESEYSLGCTDVALCDTKMF